MADKPHINLVVIGHVDHGKSTTVGRLLFEAGAVDEQTLAKLKQEAAEKGKAGFEFAYVMDTIKEERERGVTIDLTYKKFETNKYNFTIIDAPGHKDFIKNMITGTSQADAAVLVVAATNSVQEQTKEHAFLAKTLGVQQLIVAVNKMDMVSYAEDKYNSTVDDVKKLITTYGWKADDVKFLPIASLKGDNIKDNSSEMSWYKGPSLLAALDELHPPEKPTGLALRMPVQDVYSIKGIGAVPVGRIETGEMKIGQKLIGMPSGKEGELKTIEAHHEQMKVAGPGDNVGISIRGIGKDDLKRGDVLGTVDNPPTVAKEFTAKIVVLNHPSVLTIGYTPVFHINTAQVSCRVTKILKKINPKTGETLEENPDLLRNGDVAEIVCVPTRPTCIEKNSDFPQLAKVAIRDMGRTVAAGICIDVVKK
ncbi:MAG: translation elongation factor EF-1 subunit alpha [uncultured DHVE6 group euryarchaeote]|jgi:elongation factor 1-alpha|nr:MAG: translation elongation factor EF-1 subunit alpha [uncultured DHVE6 group euryarchaeote]